MLKKIPNNGIKDDINFLENSNWVIDEKTKLKELVNKKDYGTYKLSSPFGLPTHFDKIVLYCLLNEMLKKSKLDSLEMTTTRYAIAIDIYGKKMTKPKIYSRIMDALKKWTGVNIQFEGTFFEKDRYTDRYFHIIDDVILYHDTKQLYIKFNQQYIKQLRETKFFKYIDFDVYRTFQRAISARLYEILCKSLEYQSSWSIGIQKMAEKLTLQKREGAEVYYASDVLAKIKPGINELSKKSTLNLEFTYNKANDTITFKRIKKIKSTTTIVPAKKTKFENAEPIESLAPKYNKKDIDQCIAYFQSLSAEEQARLNHKITKEPFLKFIPDQSTKIFAYMTQNKLWKVSE